MSIASQSWFGWSLLVIVGLPVLVLALSELHLRLRRSGNALAKPVNRLRLWLLPLGALLILLTQAGDLSGDNNGVRVVATLVGLLTVTVALGAVNAVLFGNATQGTWRERLPSIFVDLARLILVAAGAAVVASAVWDLDVSGLWATLGVGSIVIGLALQNAIGSVVSGLLLLFEQPFRIGDRLDVGGVSGKVVEMNWRSTHLDTGSGIQVIPNSTLAGASFANLSRPTPDHDHAVTTAFAKGDDPQEVTHTLLRVARGLPTLRPDATPTVRVAGDGTYVTTLPLASASQISSADSTFLSWLWYASRRHELSLDGETYTPPPREVVVAALERVRDTLDLLDEEIEALADQCHVETYGQGEAMTNAGRVNTRYAFIVGGRVRLHARTADGALVPVVELEDGDVLAPHALLRAARPRTSVALTNVEVLQIPLASIDQLIAAKPFVSRVLNALISTRDEQSRTALEEISNAAGLDVPGSVLPLRPPGAVLSAGNASAADY